MPVPENEKNTPPEHPETILVAHVTVHLISGESFDLLPFRDAEDVKSQVTELLDDWSKSGYLVRGNQIYPWHQVKVIEGTSVDEVTASEAEQRILDHQILDLAHMQQAFWKTRNPKAKEEKKEGGEGPPPAGH